MMMRGKGNLNLSLLPGTLAHPCSLLLFPRFPPESIPLKVLLSFSEAPVTEPAIALALATVAVISCDGRESSSGTRTSPECSSNSGSACSCGITDRANSNKLTQKRCIIYAIKNKNAAPTRILTKHRPRVAMIPCEASYFFLPLELLR